MNISRRLLEIIFGEESAGDTPQERAATSVRTWVRGQDQLALMRPGATGLQMSSRQALKVYGLEKLYEAIDKGAAVIVCAQSEPSASLVRLRTARDMSQRELADLAGVDVQVVLDAENPAKRNSIHDLAKVFAVFKVDPLEIGIKEFR